MARTAYLDWNATAPLRPEARAVMAEAFEVTGNPSSVHAFGRAARRLVERAREQVAALVGAAPADVVFTSGGTEANVQALAPELGEVLLVSAIEHPSVRSGGRFAAVRDIPVTAAGLVDLGGLRAQLKDVARPLASVMLANNETGVVQPISEISALVHQAGGLLHVDAIQGPGRIHCDINELRADLITLSAHKIGGPQGVGALVRRPGLDVPPLLKGGGQERGGRAGTENVAGIAGFGAAAEAARRGFADETAHMAKMRDLMEQGIMAAAPDAVIFGQGAPRLPNTTLFSMRGLKAETAVIAFDLDGVAVSSGSACSSGKVAPSHVLAAMGVDQALAMGAIRVSVGYSTKTIEIDSFQNTWDKLAKALYKAGKVKEIAA